MSRRYRDEEDIIEENNNKTSNTGAKKAGKTIAAIVLVGGLTIGSIVAATHIANTVSSSKAKSLVESYTVNDCLTLPENVTINQAYDLNYCDGKKLYDEITKKGIKYCDVLDEYYTEDGRDIAVLTISGTYAEYIPADCIEVNGTKIYMAPVGYELEGEYAYRIINKSYKQIIEKQDDYSNIQVNGLDDVSIEIEEVHSRPFNDIISETLIVDVPDGAILNHNQECSGSFRLVPKE